MTPETPKFFILRFIEELLLGWGAGSATANTVTFVTACLILILLVWLLNFAGTKILVLIVHKAVARTKTLWDDFLLRRKFFARLVRLISALILLVSARAVFRGYSPDVIATTITLVRIYIIAIGALIISALLEAANDMFESKPVSRQKSIKSTVQAIRIVVYIVAAILAVSVLFKKDPTQLLYGLGASAAILSLVFKDTILGFVASIQIAAQDMIRPGDWIEMPSKNADGTVTDINVNSIKVRNWDNTVTIIPIYTVVSDAFTNWRNMEESEGRRFRRPLLIDIRSIAVTDPQETERILGLPSVRPYAEGIRKMMETSATGMPFTTNLGLYRFCVETFLNEHPYVTHNLTQVVRHLPQDENGAVIELYGFCTQKSFVPYERIVSGIVESCMALAPSFGISLYQRPAAETQRPGSPIKGASDSASEKTS